MAKFNIRVPKNIAVIDYLATLDLSLLTERTDTSKVEPADALRHESGVVLRVMAVVNIEDSIEIVVASKRVDMDTITKICTPMIIPESSPTIRRTAKLHLEDFIVITPFDNILEIFNSKKLKVTVSSDDLEVITLGDKTHSDFLYENLSREGLHYIITNVTKVVRSI